MSFQPKNTLCHLGKSTTHRHTHTHTHMLMHTEQTLLDTDWEQGKKLRQKMGILKDIKVSDKRRHV